MPERQQTNSKSLHLFCGDIVTSSGIMKLSAQWRLSFPHQTLPLGTSSMHTDSAVLLLSSCLSANFREQEVFHKLSILQYCCQKAYLYLTPTKRCPSSRKHRDRFSNKYTQYELHCQKSTVTACMVIRVCVPFWTQTLMVFDKDKICTNMYY